MGKMVAFTGIDYAGRTTTILNIAVVLAQEGNRVLVVDAEQTRSKITAAINISAKESGLLEAVTCVDKEVFDQCFTEEKKSKVTFITLTEEASCGDMFSLTTNQAEMFYKKVKERFDYILVDCGNVFYEPLTDIALIMAHRIFMILPCEKRSVSWLASTEKTFELLEEKFIHTASNLREIPEISAAQLYKRKKYLQIPYIFNMQDYTSVYELFYENPTGKKAQEYLSVINEMIFIVKELQE